jgi:predicted PurR-regulated permease PerM
MFKSKSPTRRTLWLIVFAGLVYSVAQRPERLAGVLSYIWSIISCVAAGLFVAFVLNLIMVPIEHGVGKLFKKAKPGLKRGISLSITYIIAIAVIALMAYSIIPSLRNAADTAISRLPEAFQMLPGVVTDILTRLGVTAEKIASINETLNNTATLVVEYISGSVTDIAGFAFNLTTGLVGGLLDVVLTIAISVYALAGKERISKFVSEMLSAYMPEKPRAFAFDLRNLVYEKFSEFFKGQVLEAMILGLMCFIGMLIFGFPNPAAISAVVGVCAIIPVLGPWAGSISGILLTMIYNPSMALWFALYILVIQQVEDNVFYPRIVGKQMKVSGLLVLCAVVIGGEIHGMLGIILAVPLSAVAYELLTRSAKARLERPKEDADK